MCPYSVYYTDQHWYRGDRGDSEYQGVGTLGDRLQSWLSLMASLFLQMSSNYSLLASTSIQFKKTSPFSLNGLRETDKKWVCV